MLTCGNRKLGDSIYNFNLPRTSCLHKTTLCDQYCYARRNFWNCKSVINSMGRNLELTNSNNFVKVISAQISYLKIKDNLQFVRLHSSGDFYSQEYWDKWNQIASNHPDIIFLAYTRNHEIDCSKKVDNFKMYYSIDGSTNQVNQTIKLKSYIIDKAVIKKHMMKLPETNSYMCQSKCKDCKFCYLSNLNVTFVKH